MYVLEGGQKRNTERLNYTHILLVCNGKKIDDSIFEDYPAYSNVIYLVDKYFQLHTIP